MANTELRLFVVLFLEGEGKGGVASVVGECPAQPSSPGRDFDFPRRGAQHQVQQAMPVLSRRMPDLLWWLDVRGKVGSPCLHVGCSFQWAIQERHQYGIGIALANLPEGGKFY